MNEPMEAVPVDPPAEGAAVKEPQKLYHVSFRQGLQPKAAAAKIQDLAADETVLVQTDHGPEPATVCGSGIELTPVEPNKPLELLPILRRANSEEVSRYQNLLLREQEAKSYCQRRIRELGLEMKLLRVERFFNGSKIIFYFSAETRVDFRDLVKSLVQEFRTRVEMRQIGVRHETQMLGGIGCCGRELCCGLFMKDFAPVSIKMAKEQDLPLNPAKISGVCNRLLCCLTHEYETYKALKKGMPKVGRVITLDDKPYKVNQCKTLHEVVVVTAVDDPTDTRTLSREEWEKGVSLVKVKTEAEGEERPAAGRSGPSRAQLSSPGGGHRPRPSAPEARGPGKGPAGRPPSPQQRPAGPGSKPPPATNRPPTSKPAGERNPAPAERQPAARPRPAKGEQQPGRPAATKPPQQPRRGRGPKKEKPSS